MEHELKIYPKYFEDVISGKKKFEIRKNDRKFTIGDVLILIRAEVIYLLSDNFIGIQPGYVVMGIKKLEN